MNKVSLFSGGGGLDLGFASVGFASRFCSDIDPYSCRTLLMNSAKMSQEDFFFRVPVVEADIRNLSSEMIMRAANLGRTEIDVMVGGPPCQSFSVFGKRGGLNDPRGQLGWEYLRLIKELNPKVFVFENVSGLLTIEGGKVFSTLVADCEALGFKVDVLFIDACNFGVPQFRKRVFLIGNRLGRSVGTMLPTHQSSSTQTSLPFLPHWRTVSDAFRGLGAIGTVPNHVGRVHSERIVSRYSALAFGERDSLTRINRLNPDRPSFTIIVGSDKGGGKGHVHPTEPREVTPRESARIQTFPDWWEFCGTSRHPIRQIGNAVPPVLAAEVGNLVRERLFDLPRVALADILRKLGQEHLYNPEAHIPSSWDSQEDSVVVCNRSVPSNQAIAIL